MKKVLLSLALFLAFLTFAAPASANHSWGEYHWARTANPFALKLGDNLSANWDAFLTTTSNDWSASSVLDTIIVPGNGSKNCKPTAGRVEVCNSTYGRNGWLGIAQIWLSGSHITQGITKLNDTYFKTAQYNTVAWKNLVTCQEVGHTFGLGHQDEGFDNPNLGTCMDYTSNPTSNQHPNAHDYEQLETMYAHLDVFTTIGAALPTGNRQESFDNPSDWGRLVSQEGRVATYERDLGNGRRIATHVIWADDGHGRDEHHDEE